MLKLMFIAVGIIVYCFGGESYSTPTTIDFQFLLDPKGIQITVEKLRKVAQVVKLKKSKWEYELKEFGSNEDIAGIRGLNTLIDSSSIQGLKPFEIKELMEKYGSRQLLQEKESQLRQKIILSTNFLETIQSLENLLKIGISKEGGSFVQFSSIRRLVKTLRELSFDIFSEDEAIRDFGEICIDMLSIRNPTVNLKRHYKEFCF